LIIAETTRNPVQPIRKNPFRLETKPIPVFSNNAVTKKNAAVKIIEVHIMNLLSFLRNGNAIKKSPIGNMKNCIPPHEPRPKASKTPAPTIFAAETFPLSSFIALISR
jgi:hypothetical protein